MVSGEVISPSYENPLIKKWVLVSHGEIFKLRPRLKGVEEVKLKVYTLPKSIIAEGLRAKDDYGDDFKIEFGEGEVGKIMEELASSGSAEKILLDSMQDKGLIERVAATQFRDVLRMRVSEFEMYDTIYLRDTYLPADRRNVLIIAPVKVENRSVKLVYLPGKSFARFSTGGLSPLKTLDLFLRGYKSKLRKLGNELRKILILGGMLAIILLVTQTLYILFLKKMAS